MWRIYPSLHRVIGHMKPVTDNIIANLKSLVIKPSNYVGVSGSSR
jgi:hypothetical protein